MKGDFVRFHFLFAWLNEQVFFYAVSIEFFTILLTSSADIKS